MLKLNLVFLSFSDPSCCFTAASPTKHFNPLLIDSQPTCSPAVVFAHWYVANLFVRCIGPTCVKALNINMPSHNFKHWPLILTNNHRLYLTQVLKVFSLDVFSRGDGLVDSDLCDCYKGDNGLRLAYYLRQVNEKCLCSFDNKLNLCI